jgi:hypothetical protein
LVQRKLFESHFWLQQSALVTQALLLPWQQALLEHFTVEFEPQQLVVEQSPPNGWQRA